MPHVVQLGDIATRWRRYLGLRGKLDGSVDIDIKAVAVAADLTGPPYADLPARWAANVPVTASAAQYGRILIGNPPTSNILAVLDLVAPGGQVQKVDAALYRGYTGQPTGTVVGRNWLNPSPEVLGSSAPMKYLPIEITTTHTALVWTGGLSALNFSNSAQQWTQPVTLRPGDVWVMQTQNVNVAVDFNVAGRAWPLL